MIVMRFLWIVFILFPIEQCVQAKWLQTSVSRSLSVQPSEAYILYSDLTQQPTWSPWITSVNVVDKESGLSRWTMRYISYSITFLHINSPWKNEEKYYINSKFGLSYSWTAKNTICNISTTDKDQVNRYDICWESIDGVPNRGHASFYLDNDKLSKMTLTIQYSLPDPLAFIIQSFGKNNSHSITLYFIFILYF